MSRLKVDRGHSEITITIPSAAVYTDAFLMVVVKMLELYDPTTERSEYHQRLLEASLAPVGPVFMGHATTEPKAKD